MKKGCQVFVDSRYHVLPSGRSGKILTGAILFDKERRNLMCKVLLGASSVAAEILTRVSHPRHTLKKVLPVLCANFQFPLWSKHMLSLQGPNLHLVPHQLPKLSINI